jgi:hypothetical protein
MTPNDPTDTAKEPGFTQLLAATRLPNRTLRLALRCAIISAIAILVAGSLLAQQPRAEESGVESAFLYNFGKFVKWPGTAGGPSFTICVLGRDQLGPQLDSIVAGESVDGKPIAVRRIANTQEAATCQILFISRAEQSRVNAILSSVEKMPVLTVSDMPQFIDRGGMIQFVLDQGRVRFAVNLGSAENSGLSMSSELLKVASQVKRGRD